jgi:hypothetical protein
MNNGPFIETRNPKRCINLIGNMFFPKLTEHDRLYRYTHFQHNSATAHTTGYSMAAVSHDFGDRVISGSVGQIFPQPSRRMICMCGVA